MGRTPLKSPNPSRIADIYELGSSMTSNEPLQPMSGYYAWQQGNNAGHSEMAEGLVSILAWDRYRNPVLIGSGFLVVATGGYGIVLTASHNIEGVVDVQGVRRLKHASALDEFCSRQVQLDRNRIHAILWSDPFTTCDVVGLSGSNSIDVAALAIVPNSVQQPGSLELKYKIDTNLPSVGEEVYIFGPFHNEIAQDDVVINDNIGFCRIYREWLLRRGRVKNIYPLGRSPCNWCCIETTIPVPPGLSGSPLLVRRGDQYVACGVMTYDASDHDAEGNWEISGSSFATPLWLAMGIKVPGRIIVQRNDTDCELESFLDLVCADVVQDIGSANLKTTLRDNDDGGYNIQRVFAISITELQQFLTKNRNKR